MIHGVKREEKKYVLGLPRGTQIGLGPGKKLDGEAPLITDPPLLKLHQ